MLKVKFVGAVEGVSGSCTWLHHTDSDTQFLVDCGMNQGSTLDAWKNNQPFPFNPSQIKYVLLTHAHIDHCGLIPKLVKENFCGVIYATRATRELTEIMLRDSAKVNGTPNHIKLIESINWSILDDDLGFKWGRVIRMAEGLRFSFLRSSHILGACCISVSWMVKDAEENFDKESEKNIFFSGDIGSQSDENPYLPLMKAGHNPFPNTNFIVTEATYGSRIRSTEIQCAETRRKRLADTILHTVYNKKGKVILPAFSLHRTQELLADLHWWLSEGWASSDQADLMGKLVDGKYENPLRICVDSPLGYKVTEAYKNNLFQRSPNGKYKYLKDPPSDDSCSKFESFMNDLFEAQGSFYNCGNLIKLFNPESKQKPKNVCNKQKKQINKSERKFEVYPVIVASAGMCGAGPVAEYLERFGNDPANTIILTGYQSAGTPGRFLMERATIQCSDPERLPEGKAEVIDMSGFYSAHADQNMLLDSLFSLGGYKQSTPAKVLINHGDVESKKSLEEAIRKRIALKIPNERVVNDVNIADARWIDLNSDEYLPEIPVSDASSAEEIKLNMVEIKSEMRELQKMLAQLLERIAA
ncbi:MBL fold metallo-hydrolase [Geopsychrobacter electrodiphilus]|uniref:MBL fold metallo-hydrolase n=1 Tax=Geopsychrobacter electrodiphilus TaxID=225196 RepID=UPI0003761E60|nr:MBL fold metallo-hydrolase [Geopsychrobacter electrodiphilus]